MNIYSVEEIQNVKDRFDVCAEVARKLNRDSVSGEKKWGRIVLGADGYPEVHVAKSAKGKVWHFLKVTVLRPYMYYQNYKLLKNLESSVRECFGEDHRENAAKEIREIAAMASVASKSRKPYMGSYQNFADYVAEFAAAGGRKFQAMETEGSSPMEVNDFTDRRDHAPPTEVNDSTERRAPAPPTEVNDSSMSGDNKLRVPLELERADGEGNFGSKEQGLMAGLSMFGQNRNDQKSREDMLSERNAFLPGESSELSEAKPLMRSKGNLGRRKSFSGWGYPKQDGQSKNRPTSRVEIKSFSERPGLVGFGASPMKRRLTRTPDGGDSVFSVDLELSVDEPERQGTGHKPFNPALKRPGSAGYLRSKSTFTPTLPRRSVPPSPSLKRASSTGHLRGRSTLMSTPTPSRRAGAGSTGDLSRTLRVDGGTVFLHVGNQPADSLLGDEDFEGRAKGYHTEREGRIRTKIHKFSHSSVFSGKLHGKTLGALSKRLNLGVKAVVLRSVSLLDDGRLGYANYWGFINFLQPGYGQGGKSEHAKGSRLVGIRVNSSELQCEESAFFPAAWEAMLEYEILHNPVEGEATKPTSDVNTVVTLASKLSTGKSSGKKIITKGEDLVDPLKIIYEKYVTDNEEIFVEQDDREETLTHL